MISKKGNEDKAIWLEGQIAKRISVVQEKIKGNHENLDVPLSLRQNRVWVNEELGIEEIGSPTSFTMTHKQHGVKVNQLNNLLIKLKEPSKKKYKPLNKINESLQQENTELKDLLKKTANQFVEWESELNEKRDMLQITQSSEQGLIEAKRELQDELNEKDKIIKNLRLELVVALNLSKKDNGSNITQVYFGKDSK